MVSHEVEMVPWWDGVGDRVWRMHGVYVPQQRFSRALVCSEGHDSNSG